MDTEYQISPNSDRLLTNRKMVRNFASAIFGSVFQMLDRRQPKTGILTPSDSQMGVQCHIG